MHIWFKNICIYTYWKLLFHDQDNRDTAILLDFSLFLCNSNITKDLTTLFLSTKSFSLLTKLHPKITT